MSLSGQASGQAKPRPSSLKTRRFESAGIEDTLLRAASREAQPHLHPRKLNGALW
ncbi:unnamed protein product [Arabidopsis halleri]